MQFLDWQSPGRVAIVHDWLTGMRGGEAILDAICTLFPQADLFTLLQTDYKMSPAILRGRKVHHSYLQKLMHLPRFQSGYRMLLPLFPHAIESLDLSSYDLILSNTHCVAKGVKKKEGAIHMAYVSTPMRYMWDMFPEYFGAGKSSLLAAKAAKLLQPHFQKWDVESTKGVDFLLANSEFVSWRIKEFWQRDSVVVHPFFDKEKFQDRFEEPKDFYLIVSAMAPYKKIDLAIEACARLGKNLKVVGKGQDEKKLKKLAKSLPKNGGSIEFLGGLSNESLGEFYRKTKAFLFPGLEDFGITPLEAMYNGRPVIAYGKGGLLDTVTEKTGIFFPEQSVESLMEAIQTFEKKEFKPEDCRARSLLFTRERFLEKYSQCLQRALAGEKT